MAVAGTKGRVPCVCAIYRGFRWHPRIFRTLQPDTVRYFEFLLLFWSGEKQALPPEKASGVFAGANVKRFEKQLFGRTSFELTSSKEASSEKTFQNKRSNRKRSGKIAR